MTAGDIALSPVGALGAKKGSMGIETQPFVVDGTITWDGQTKSIRILIDTGADGCYIDPKIVSTWPTNRYSQSMVPVDYSGRKGAPITCFALLNLTIDGHQSLGHFSVGTLSPAFDAIVGKEYLHQHYATLDCRSNRIYWRCPDCLAIKMAPNRPRNGPDVDLHVDVKKDQPEENRVASVQPTGILRRVQPKENRGQEEVALAEENRSEVNGTTINVCSISAVAANKMSRYCETTVAWIQVSATTESVPKTLPDWLKEYKDCFSDDVANSLPEHSDFDVEVMLLPGANPEQDVGKARQWRQTDEELAAVKKYVEENLAAGLLEMSHAPYSSPVLLVKKPDGSLRMCVDYRKVNQIIKSDAYPIPRIDDLIDRLSRAKRLTKLDIKRAFNRLRMSKTSEELTTFATRYGTYKSKVLPFGLSIGPAVWQRFINETLGIESLDEESSAYLDDILLFDDQSIDYHRNLVRQTLEKLRKAGLTCDLKKCEFEVQETPYLGIIVGTSGIRIDPAKTSVLTEWLVPRTVKDIRKFVGFCSFYRRFIKSFSQLSRPLTKLTQKDQEWKWGPEQDKAFQDLKTALTSTPVLCHFNRSKTAYIECDASDVAIGGVLSQRGEDGQLHPVAFFSQTMLPAETNYDIYDKELLAIIRAL